MADDTSTTIGEVPEQRTGAAPASFGFRPAIPAPDGAPTTDATPPPSSATPLADAERTASPPTGVPATPGTPVRVRVGSIDVDAPVVPVALEPSGAMELPPDVREVGWFAPGVAPGTAQGSAVLAGHVDSRAQGRGALFDLGEVELGDVIEVDDDTGTTRRWLVTGRTTYPKDTLPVEALFTRAGDPQLVLITCGGDFDRDTGHYERNVVVVASPA
ncbi:sortase domain-bontaining protein [Egicoccus sp. AB-alg6-2]|uniref:class F sortase n=1 Tax=Egicoccus sp. AB-alg6-2 TaxID=3242692 RepID=UPI00359D6F4D